MTEFYPWSKAVAENKLRFSLESAQMARQISGTVSQDLSANDFTREASGREEAPLKDRPVHTDRCPVATEKQKPRVPKPASAPGPPSSR